MPKTNYYTSSGTQEADMRQEMINTLDGTWPEVSKKQRCVIRSMKRTEDGTLVECPCRSSTNKEPDKDVFCPYCFQEGYLWQEVWADMYKHVIRSDVGNATRESLVGPGLENVEVAVFFLRYTYDITKEDKIVTLNLKKNGAVSYPYKRERVYRIDGLIPLRCDHGKLEFWKLACYEEDVKFLNGPKG